MVGNDAAISLGARGQGLSLQDVVDVARSGRQVAQLDDEVTRALIESATWVANVVEEVESRRKEGEKADPYYGINTGFGALAGREALDNAYLTRVLSRNLAASHSIAVGEYFDEETIRAAMLLRAQSLSLGYSGVRPLIIQKLIDMLNRRVYPAVPSKGSLGASGDLAPLAHLALVMSKVPEPAAGDKGLELDRTGGEAFMPLHGGPIDEAAGSARYHLTVHRETDEQTLWRRVSGDEAMEAVNGKVELLAKEGLALINGTTFSTAIGALTLYDAWNLLRNSELACSMTLEAIRGFQDPFFPEVHRLRPHPGAQTTAQHIMRYISGSKLLDPGSRDRNPQRIPPQDPYSVRCAPQVLGTVRDTLKFVQGIFDVELNAATDNPLLFVSLPESRTYKAVSGGNFHGEPIAMAMDFLGIAITELGNIAERRIFMLMDYSLPKRNGQQAPSTREWHRLPSFLIGPDQGPEGLNSGLMLAQYTAASLVSDCKTLAHPDSVDSIPSSANKEDHVSMSLNAARHARAIVDNIESVVAIELLCAAQALDLRLKLDESLSRQGAEHLGAGTKAAYRRIREEVKYLDHDRVLYPDLRAITRLVRSGELVRLARLACAAAEQ